MGHLGLKNWLYTAERDITRISEYISGGGFGTTNLSRSLFHDDVNDIEINPYTNEIFYATDGGLYIQKTLGQVRESSQGLDIGRIWRFSFSDVDPNHITLSNQDVGTHYSKDSPINDSYSWNYTSQAGGDGYASVYNKSENILVYIDGNDSYTLNSAGQIVTLENVAIFQPETGIFDVGHEVRHIPHSSGNIGKLWTPSGRKLHPVLNEYVVRNGPRGIYMVDYFNEAKFNNGIADIQAYEISSNSNSGEFFCDVAVALDCSVYGVKRSTPSDNLVTRMSRLEFLSGGDPLSSTGYDQENLPFNDIDGSCSSPGGCVNIQRYYPSGVGIYDFRVQEDEARIEVNPYNSNEIG